jgi:hypothetical protein
VVCFNLAVVSTNVITVVVIIIMFGFRFADKVELGEEAGWLGLVEIFVVKKTLVEQRVSTGHGYWMQLDLFVKVVFGELWYMRMLYRGLVEEHVFGVRYTTECE